MLLLLGLVLLPPAGVVILLGALTLGLTWTTVEWLQKLLRP